MCEYVYVCRCVCGQSERVVCHSVTLFSALGKLENCKARSVGCNRNARLAFLISRRMPHWRHLISAQAHCGRGQAIKNAFLLPPQIGQLRRRRNPPAAAAEAATAAHLVSNKKLVARATMFVEQPTNTLLLRMGLLTLL